MGALRVYCSGCSKSWPYINVGDVEVACAGLSNVKALIKETQKGLAKAARKCDADALSFGDSSSASMKENLSAIVADIDSLASKIEELKAIIIGAAQSDEATQKAEAEANKAACEAKHEEEARKAAEAASLASAQKTKTN